MSNIILKENLFKSVLISPAEAYDELCVISGFATPSMVVHHFETVKNTFDKDNLKINLIVGMTSGSSGISKLNHKNFVKLVGEKEFFKCSYLNATATPSHSKLYTWLKNGIPKVAFLTSANYTLNAFKREQDEIATECDPQEAYEYFKSKDPFSLYCNCDEAENLVRSDRYNVRLINNSIDDQINIENKVDTVYLPLFSERDNRIHTHSGLNWGQRAGREPNQAYIPIPSIISKTGFFPPRGEQFSVLTDDGFPFVCVVAQDGDKAIHTTNNNSEFGEYFRQRLGVPLGKPVTLEDLDRFGNRYVKFTKISEEEYLMEFHKNESLENKKF